MASVPGKELSNQNILLSNGVGSMIFKNEKGIALLLVITVMLVLSILGITFLSVALTDNKVVAYQEKSMQAYYIARSGADSIAAYLNKNPDNLDPIQMRTFINNMISADETEDVSLGKGHFVLTVMGDINDPFATVSILSKGYVDTVKKEVSLDLVPIGIPEVPDNALSATIIGWLNGNSHVIDKMTDTSNLPVKFESGNLQITIKTTPNDTPNYTAESMFFLRNVFIDNKSTFKLKTDIIVFKGWVELNTHQKQQDGQLELYTLYSDIDGSTIGGVTGTKYGIVYFLEGVKYGALQIVHPGSYYYPNNFVLPTAYNKGYQDGGLIPFDIISGYKLVWQ